MIKKTLGVFVKRQKMRHMVGKRDRERDTSEQERDSKWIVDRK